MSAELPQEPNSTFSPGQTLLDRFRIIRLIAAGGMGEVYEAFDLTLNQSIALKTIHPEIAHDESAIERFKQEVQLARQVTHPNVCRIFDIFHHHPEDEDPVVFVTMELLPGESLASHLRRHGRIPPEEALPLVRQMAAGLQAAHRADVLHRDFKCENVTLVPAPEMDGGARIVITDFGLASAVSSGAGVYDEDGFILGTPAYMAPECLIGRPVTPAADLYSLGVVIYETTTGRLPFPAEGSEEDLDSGNSTTTMRSLGDLPPSPREIHPEYDPIWDEAIMRCFLRKPEDRFADAGELLQALEQPPPGPPPLRGVIFALLVLLLFSAGMTVLLRSLPERESPQLLQRSNAVAPLGFENLSPQESTDWIATALSEMLVAELGASPDLQIIPGENIQRLQDLVDLPASAMLAPDTLEKIRVHLGADHVVRGSYYADGSLPENQIRVNLKLQSTGPDGSPEVLTDSSTVADLLGLVTRLGARLREKLNVPQASSELSVSAARSALPENPEAGRLYAEGLAHLRLFDSKTARTLLEQAALLDPESPRIHSALSVAAANLGFDELSEEEARRAFELSADLPQTDRLFIEGRYREAAREWDQAAEIYRSLIYFFPENLEYGLRLAAAEREAGQGTESLLTLQRLSELRPPTGDDPRIDLEKAKTARILSDLPRARAAAQRAAEKGIESGAWLLVAHARLEEAVVFRRMGDNKRCLEATIAARQIFTEVGDESGVARTLDLTGNVLAGQGRLAKAKSVYEQALAIHQRIGNRRGSSAVLNNLAIVLGEEGDLEGALRHYEQALALDQEIEDLRGIAISLNNIAEIRKDQGSLEQAQSLYRESFDLFRRLEAPLPAAMLQLNLGHLALLRGRLVEAMSLLDRAIAVQNDFGDQSGLASSLQIRGEALREGGDPRAARRSFEQALRLRSQIGEDAEAAWTKASLARLDLDAGSAKSAEMLSLADELRRLGRSDEAVLIIAMAAQAQLHEGDPIAALRRLDESAAAAKSSQRIQVALEWGLARGRTSTALGEFDDARARLGGVLEAAGQASFFGLAAEARLALAENDLAAGKIAAGARRAIELQRAAQQQGWMRIAASAKALLAHDDQRFRLPAD